MTWQVFYHWATSDGHVLNLSPLHFLSSINCSI
jgi:hypothetical protein